MSFRGTRNLTTKSAKILKNRTLNKCLKMSKINKLFKTTILIYFLVFSYLYINLSAQSPQVPQKHIRVGITNDPPVEEFVNGKASGIFPSLLAVIAKENNWKIDYVYGSWDEIYNKLLSGDIDLLPNIWALQQRESLVDFSKESVINVWGQVFISEDSEIKGVADLKEKTIGIVTNEATSIAFKKFISNFNLNITFIEYPSYEIMAEALEQKKIDAGVSDNLTGFRLSQKYFIKDGNIMFSPNNLVFATKAGHNNELLNTIDKTLKAWKADKNSFYYDEIGVWISKETKKPINYNLLINIVSGLLVMIFIGFIWVFFLRRKVRKSLEKIENSQHKLILSQKSAGIVFLVWDRKTNLVETSPELNALFGLNETKPMMSGNLIIDSVHPDDVEKVEMALKNAKDKNANYNIEHRIIKPNGSVIWLHSIADMTYDEQGNLDKLTGILLDITELKTIEAEVLEYRERLERAEMVAKLGNWVLDLNTNELTLSNGAKFITGYDAGVIPLEAFKKSIVQADVEKFENAINDLVFKDKVFEVEIRFIHMETDEIINLSNYGLYDNKTKKIYVVLQDVSEKKSLERQFVQAFVDAQEVEKQAFGEDLHDGISQILSAESMYIDVLLTINKGRTDDNNKHLAKIKEMNLSAINEARNIAHGLMSKQVKEDGLIKALEHICIDYSETRNIDFTFLCTGIKEEEIPEEIKTHIFRITQEVATNTIRHSLAKKAMIILSKTQNNDLKIVIKDNGVGIDFEKMKREHKGAGIKNIERRVTLLNGTLKIDTALNQGTTFTIEAPLSNV